MNIGEKIKSLRTAKMMTQSELAGSKITRNMLSRIENGSALPSVPTMTYLAARLGVPAGYILAEEGNEFHYRKMNELPDIKRAFSAGDWIICRDLCEALGDGDDEVHYLICMCDFNAAKDAFTAGRLHEACTLFDAACIQSGLTLYPCDIVKSVSAVYIDYMHGISPSLYSEETDALITVPPESYADPFCRYYSVLLSVSPEAEDSGKNPCPIDPAQYICGTTESEKPYYSHVQARLYMKNKNYTESYRILKGLLQGNGDVPAPMMYFIFSDLEICCREMSDYRGAYEYSGDKMGMIERFLR